MQALVLAAFGLAAATARSPRAALPRKAARALLDTVVDPRYFGTGIFGPEMTPSLLNLPTPAPTPTPPPMDPATAGVWSGLIKMPLVPVAGAVVSDNVVSYTVALPALSKGHNHHPDCDP